MKPSSTRADTPARAGRPKSKAKREAILEAATTLFLAHGLQSTSMDAVASMAGVSKQTVYSHFRNKDDLFRACIKAKVASHGFSSDDLTDHGPVREDLLRLVRRFVELVFDPEVLAMFRVVGAEAVTHPKIAQLFYEAGPGATIEATERFLARQAEKGRLKIDDPAHAATVLLSMAKGEYHLWLMLNLPGEVDPAALDGHLTRTVDHFLALFGTRGESA